MLEIKVFLKDYKIKEYNKALIKAIDNGLNDITDFTATKADAIVRGNELATGYHVKHPGSFDTGMLAKSQVVDKDTEFKKEIGYEAPYACIVGSHQRVKLIDQCKSIGEIKTDNMVLSKDGKYHKINTVISKLRVINKPNLILLKCKKSRTKNGLLVTDDHLILTCKNNYIYWEAAKNLNIGDLVFHPKKIGWNKNTGIWLIKSCLYCNTEFKIKSIELKYRKADYCSRKCYHSATYHDRAKEKTWKLSIEQRKRKCGKNNASWQNGSSKLPYGPEWTKVLKILVKDRDNYNCMQCGKTEEWEDHSFHVHHIDGNKFNNQLKNLITLCPSCHGKQQWQDAELVSIDLNCFEPVELIKVEKISAFDYFLKKGALNKIKLYDLNIDTENSFVASGILIHNSYIEFGTRPHFPPIKPIYDWIYRSRANLGVKVGKMIKSKKFGMYYKDVMSFAWAICNTIVKEGSDPKPFLRPAISQGKIAAKGLLKKRIEKVKI